jgi:hypothetical protein
MECGASIGEWEEELPFGNDMASAALGASHFLVDAPIPRAGKPVPRGMGFPAHVALSRN